MTFSIIVASDFENGIGYFDEESIEYSIPWKNSEDMKFFKNITSSKSTKKAIIMGRNTYLSLKKDHLENRLNIVLTSKPHLLADKKNISIFKCLNSALNFCENNYYDTFVIGGSKLYKEALFHHKLKFIYWNRIKNIKFKCNIKFPINFNDAKILYKIDLNYHLKESELVEYNKFMAQKINESEVNYINLLKKILNKGDKRQTRNSITYSLFSEKLEFNLQNEFPLLTTKKMFLRGIFEELMWILRGQTNSKILEEKGINIWKANTTDNFLKSNNLKYKEGDVGNMYGFQLNHSGAEYIGYDNDYSNKGFNQIDYCLNLLKYDKFSRRILMSTFCPNSSNKGVLYPCHGIVIQFYVKEENNINYLSCHMYQRSADMFLGVPFNIASYSLLVYMICHVLNNDNDINIKFYPDKLTISFGDLHIYDDHIDAVKEQIKRDPYSFPQIKFNKNVTNIKDFNWNDLEIHDYKSHNSIKGKMIA